ncbi:hypothetical protein OF83DRAFT_1109071 [Amylostereum chailletii]|nr:hypothetical protein OF83DRAFT_1109071 [Amylostereum chailletii]
MGWKPNPGTPPWPSLYNPLIELRKFENGEPIHPHGKYLTGAGDVFRFTFFWMVVLHAPLFFIGGSIAVVNIIYPPSRPCSAEDTLPEADEDRVPPVQPYSPGIPLASLSPMSNLSPAFANPRMSSTIHLQVPQSNKYAILPSQSDIASATPPSRPKPQRNVHRSRAVTAFLAFVVFGIANIATAFVQSLVLGYILAGVYTAAKYNMSTWVPFIWAVVVTTSDALGVFPLVANRI